MRERNSSSRIESSDTLTNFAPQGAAEPTERERLPRGSALLLETIQMLALEISAESALDKETKAKAASIAEMAGELIARYNRQLGIAA